NRHGPGADDLSNAQWLQELDQSTNLGPVTGSFYNDSVIGDVNNLRPKNIDQTQYLLPRDTRLGFHIYQGHLALDVSETGHIRRFEHANLFVELASDLLDS